MTSEMIHQVNILPQASGASRGGLSRGGPSPITTRARIVPNEKNPASGEQLSAEEKAVLRKLQSRDAEVRAHEAAHLGASRGLAVSGANYTYETGPDGQKYAVGGEVSIDTSEGATPEETVDKARRIQAAALAPAAPSSKDLRVAAKAALMGMQAAAEVREDDDISAKEAASNPSEPSEQTPQDRADAADAVDAANAADAADADAGGGQFEFDFSGEASGETGETAIDQETAERGNPLAQRVIEKYFGDVAFPFSFLAYA